MKVEIKFCNTETIFNTTVACDRLQPTAVYAWTSNNVSKMCLLKFISDGENSFSVIELERR